MTNQTTGAHWFKSSRSCKREACVEVAWLANGQVGIRDSKNPTGPALVFGPEQWESFITDVSS